MTGFAKTFLAIFSTAVCASASDKFFIERDLEKFALPYIGDRLESQQFDRVMNRFSLRVQNARF
jgi:hypothetical protein